MHVHLCLQFYLLSMLLVVGSFSICFSWFSSANDHHRYNHHCDHPQQVYTNKSFKMKLITSSQGREF
uniref:Uncharacterized protein n=1 Tax=Glossina palpalis gambiensis TaxID=67801 RepID=A0A1B0BIM3_9MUSC